MMRSIYWNIRASCLFSERPSAVDALAALSPSFGLRSPAGAGTRYLFNGHSALNRTHEKKPVASVPRLTRIRFQDFGVAA
jgi:hypothetical protein